jgi:hypothetical protein
MTNDSLSPVAQAVLDACSKARDAALDGEDLYGLSAALRVVADQLINVKWSVEMWELHRDIHAIAAELEALPND